MIVFLGRDAVVNECLCECGRFFVLFLAQRTNHFLESPFEFIIYKQSSRSEEELPFGLEL